MPVPKSMKTGKSAQQVNGFYVHSSPPRVLQVHSSIIRQWLRGGDLEQLEQLVLDGQGHKLVGEYSPDPKVRNFLKQIPAFLVKSKKLHETVAKGDLKQLQKLLSNIKSQEPPLKNIHLTKNHGGLSLLHKAVYYGHSQIVEFLVTTFPKIVNVKDNDGKTPLYYCGASKEAGKIWPMLVKAGADATMTDSKGKRPAYYMERSNEIQLPSEKNLSGISISSTTDKNNIIIKPSNIRIWIHDRDLKKLRSVIWEGHGAKLRVETSKHPKVRRFLEGIPYILNIIKDAHASVVNNDYETFVKKTSDPVPLEILGSKDINGLTPLHKAAGLNRREIAENILKRNPNLVFSVDREGKTPLHYSALLKEQSAMYSLLMGNYADETAVDREGKTASYYRMNPKELNMKLLEVIPEAPRISATLPQTFDWSLYCSEGATPTENFLPSRKSPIKIIEDENHEISKPTMEENEADSGNEDLEIKQLQNKSSAAESENLIPSGEHNFITEPEESKNFDIWTNDDDGNDKDQYEDGDNKFEGDSMEDEDGDNKEVLGDSMKDDESDNKELQGDRIEDEVGENKEVQDDRMEKDEENSENREKEENDMDERKDTEEVAEPVVEDREMKEKSEREIAEERQRLLDEGLLKINAEEEETDEDKKVDEAIETGDMEKLAAMVLNGEGSKIVGKQSSSPEVQSFLNNVPTYMNKITAVHTAARNGSLKDLQSALDRRKFAVARESFDKLGTTPLHVAVIFENSPIVKYLGGRFPETLISKDKSGRTPLHYSAVLRDDGHIYSTLLNLGADPNIKDDEGNTAAFYQNNPGKLTRESLIEEMNIPFQVHKERLNNEGVSSPMTDPSIHNAEPEISFDEGIPLSKKVMNEDAEDDDSGLQPSFGVADRDEYGQSVLHFAAARAHGRGGMFQLIHESGVNLGFRDELYRTARDIAQQANIPENVNEIDKYVISIAAKGETEKIMELFLEGYDHILDLEDDENNDIVTVVTNKNHEKTLALLKAVPTLEEKRERIHTAIRAGDGKAVEDMISESKNGRILITGKNTSGRCSLHLAVLCQRKDITEFIAQKYPETLKIGDNIERTPLHYAMGVEEVESLSKILIKCGAKRVVKDLKGRQPTYYFMNRTEILKLQEEENVSRV